MADALLEIMFADLINWLLKSKMQESDKNRIIEKLKWIKTEIDIYRKAE